MQFLQRDNFYSVSRITGPTHNYLALELAEQDGVLEPRIEALPPHGECRHAPLDEQRILQAVLEGVAQANERYGTRVAIRTARYIVNDTRPERVYALLAFRIVERLHDGGFEPARAGEHADA